MDNLGEDLDRTMKPLSEKYYAVRDLIPLLDRNSGKYQTEEHYAYKPPFDIYTMDDYTRNGQGMDEPQMYDAFVLFDHDDINFTTQLIETMEGQYNLIFCVNGRDLLASGDIDIMSKLINERCNKFLVILSPAFCDSPLYKIFLKFKLEMDLGTSQSKIIACVCKHFDELPAELIRIDMLECNRSNCSNFCELLYNVINDRIRLQFTIQQIAAQQREFLSPTGQTVKFQIDSSSDSEIERNDQPLISGPDSAECRKHKKKLSKWLKNLLPKRHRTQISTKPTNISKEKKIRWNRLNGES